MEDKEFVKKIRRGRKTINQINRPLFVSFNAEQDFVDLSRYLTKLKEADAEVERSGGGVLRVPG